MSGPNSSSEWSIEGRRLVPLMPRLVPQTAFTVTANAVANATANQNASLPVPAETGNKEGATTSLSFCYVCFSENNCLIFFSCSCCLLLIHKHHMYLHQRFNSWCHCCRSYCEIPTTTQPFIQCGGVAQWKHCLCKEWVWLKSWNKFHILVLGQEIGSLGSCVSVKTKWTWGKWNGDFEGYPSLWPVEGVTR